MINDEQLNFKEMKVLDLGCGGGFVGILACLAGATTVFQDYVRKNCTKK